MCACFEKYFRFLKKTVLPVCTCNHISTKWLSQLIDNTQQKEIASLSDHHSLCSPLPTALSDHHSLVDHRSLTALSDHPVP